MRRFKFSLEKVLELRAYREREAEIELGRAVGALTVIENRLFAVAQERVQAAGRRFAPDNRIEDMQSCDRYIQRLDQTRDRLLKEAAEAELRAAEAREVYLEASRDRKVIDKVKERREREYRRKMLAGETLVLDDIASGTRARRAAEGRPLDASP